MFLIRLLYVKKKNTNSEINNNKFNNNSDNQNKKLVDDIRSSKSDLINKNKTIDQIKFSSQEKQKLPIENEKKINKTKVNSLADLISICTEKKEIELKYELENNVNLISFDSNKIEISFNENLNKNFIKNLTHKLLNWTGERWIISLSKKFGSKSIKELQADALNKNLNDLKNSETYTNAINKFPDLEVTNIKDLKGYDND